jgi:peptide/nickel transport system ATP-binding protein
MSDPILEVEDLDIHYETKAGTIRAVSDASFTVERGEYFGLVGESGSGKSTIAKALIGGLDSNGHIAGGTVKFNGEEIQDYDERDYQQNLRWKDVSLIPQGSMSSLDPIERLSDQAVELASTHTDWSAEKTVERFRELFDIVGLPESRIHDYPFQFSGGMQQRAIIAMALSCEPDLIIADEPTTALDVTIQAQILDLFNDIQTEYDTSMIYVTHDLGVVREVCDRVSVMYLGEIAENASYEELYRNPKHPYTQALLRSTVTADKRAEELDPIEGSMPSAIDPPSGCRYRTRCPAAFGDCAEVEPPSYEVGPNHEAACLLYGDDGKSDPRLHEKGGADGPDRGTGRTDGGTANGGRGPGGSR